MALGALLQGIAVEGRAYAGGWWDWLTPFSLLTGVALVVGYALLGATWLIYEDRRARRSSDAYRLALGAGHRHARAPSGGQPGDAVPQPGLHGPLVRLAAGALHRPGAAAGRGRGLGCCCARSSARRELAPFLLALALFVLVLRRARHQLLSLHRPAVGHDLGCGRARQSLAFLLVGAAVLVPMILAYTAYSYWVFRGKVNAVGGYH